MTGPNKREDPDARRRTDERRNEQTRPPRMPPGWPTAPNARQPPTPVHIVSATDDFFRGFNKQVGPNGEAVDPAHGFRSVISDQRAMAQSVKQVTDELRRAVDMAQQFSVATRDALTAQREATTRGDQEQQASLRRMLDAIEQTLTRQNNREEEGRQRRRRTPDDDYVDLDDLPGAPPPRPAGPRRPPDRSGGEPWETEAPAEYGPGYGPQRAPEDRTAARGRDRQQDLDDQRITQLRGRARPPGRSRHDLRRHVERSVAERVHQQWGQGEGGRGTLLPQYDENGDISHHIYRRAGQEDEIIQNGDSRLPGLMRMAGGQRIVSGIASGLETAGLAGAARAIPVVGWGIAAADMANHALQWVGNENRKSSYYQGIYAGDSKYGDDALGQRLQEEGYTWGQRLNAFNGGLTDEDARTAFKGVSEIGWKGSERDNALSLIEKEYADLGVNVQTSLKLIQMSASGANTSLNGLDTSLKNVGQMARLTGQNANVLYEAFANNYQLALGMSLGANAPGMASALTELTSGTSRDLSNINYAPLASETSRRIIGQVSGHSYSWLEAQYAQGNTQPYTQAVDRKNDQAYRGALAGQGSVAQTIQDEINKRGGTDKVKGDKGAWRDIALSAMEAPGADPENLKRYLNAMGIEDVSGLTDQQVYERVVQHELGADSLTDATTDTQQKLDQHALGRDSSGREDLANNTESRGFLDLNQITGTQFVRDRYSTAVSGNPWLKWFGWGGEANKNDALDAYTNRQAGKTSGGAGLNKSDPVIENLIDKLGKDSNVGIKVQTGKGEKVVSLSDAITYYPDQLTSGKATVVGGDDPSMDGQSVESLVGGKESNTTDIDTTKNTDDSSTPGATEGDWRKDHPSTATADDKTTATGKITLDMSDDLKKWFTANVSGNVTDPSTESAAGSSVPPTVSGGLPR